MIIHFQYKHQLFTNKQKQIYIFFRPGVAKAVLQFVSLPIDHNINIINFLSDK